jgi:hypothetical protein
MVEAVAARKQQVIANCENGVAGTPPCSCDPQGCQPCRRVDLQLLVVTPSIVPKEHEAALKAAGYAWAPSFDAGFGNLKREATLPVARIARAGYVMLYYPQRRRWDVWQVMANGLTRKVMHQVDTDQYGAMQGGFLQAVEPKLCSRGAANLPAHLISIEGGVRLTEVWMAYAPRLWPKAVLQRLAEDPTIEMLGEHHRLRDLLGRELNPRAILEGRALPAGSLPLNASALGHNVADFVERSDADFIRAFDLALRPLDPVRFGQGEALAQCVRDIERASGPSGHPQLYRDKSLVVCLPDAVGVSEQHNVIRLATLSARQGWMAGGVDATGRNPDPNRPWERQSLLHAGYVRSWVREAELRRQKDLDAVGAYRTSAVISGVEYREIRDREARGQGPFNPPGTLYERLASEPERYRVTWPQHAVDRGLKGVADANTQGRIDRYNKHIDWDRVDAANKKWLQQEQGWLRLIESRDRDHVAWLQSPALAAALRYTHTDNGALRRTGLQREEAETHLFDAAARLEDTARCYGGGACSDASLRHLVALFEKDPQDKTQWIAEALIGQYDFWSLLKGDDTDDGLRADLYTGALGVRTSYENLAQGAQLLRQGMAQHASLLAQAAQQALFRMQELALDAGKAKQFGLKSSLLQLQRKQVVWVQAMALHDYLESGRKQFYVKVAWDGNAFLNAANDGLKGGAAFEMKFNQHSERRQKSRKSAASSAQAELRRLIENSEHPQRLTVPLLLDGAAIQAIVSKGHKVGPGMLTVVGGNLLGLPQAPLALPEALARDLFRTQAMGRAEMFKQWGETSVRNARGALPGSVGNAFIVLLQWNAFMFALGEFNKSGGWAQLDAAASALSAATGMIGAGLEVGALLLAPVNLTKARTPAPGVLISQLPRAYLRLGLGAGMMGATGAGLDFVVACAKFRGRLKRGDEDAFTMYLTSSILHLGGSASLFVGYWAAYRAARLTEAGMQGAVRILGLRFASSFTAAGFGLSVIGLGMLLWVVGVSAGVIAAMLEDDQNETFLERSYFGWGRERELGKFTSLEQEVFAIASLARGCRAELQWEDNISAPDVITVRIQTTEFASRRLKFVLDAYDGINGKRLGALAEGEFDDLKVSGGVFEETRRFPISDEMTKAVRLTFVLWDICLSLKSARLDHATKVAEDFIWLED